VGTQSEVEKVKKTDQVKRMAKIQGDGIHYFPLDLKIGLGHT
jgi:hypothetical protein